MLSTSIGFRTRFAAARDHRVKIRDHPGNVVATFTVALTAHRPIRIYGVSFTGRT